MRYLSFIVSVFLALCASAQENEGFRKDGMVESMQPGDKAALLMVHFGTTYDETRGKTIEAINAKAKTTFPELEFREAYTSRIVIRRLRARGMQTVLLQTATVR